MKAQKQVSKNIEARGCYEGYTPVALLARHIAKLAEELEELMYGIHYHSSPDMANFEYHLQTAGEKARSEFDHSKKWNESQFAMNERYSTPYIKNELADIQVIVFSMAQLINNNFGEYDVTQAALDKSEADIERGVRK